MSSKAENSDKNSPEVRRSTRDRKVITKYFPESPVSIGRKRPKTVSDSDSSFRDDSSDPDSTIVESDTLSDESWTLKPSRPKFFKKPCSRPKDPKRQNVEVLENLRNVDNVGYVPMGKFPFLV